MSLLHKPFLAVAFLFIWCLLVILILRGVSTTRTIRFISSIGQAYAAYPRAQDDEDFWRLFPVEVPQEVTPANWWVQHPRLWRILFFICVWLLVLLIDLLIWGTVWHVPGF